MEAVSRKPLQGIINIIRFNWHLYFIAICIVGVSHIAKPYFPLLHPVIGITGIMIIAITLISLIVSFYIYDLSNLYKLDWLNFLDLAAGSKLINIHAGFDETSALFLKKYPKASITVLDFYDPRKHTEISIKRARKVCAVYPGTKTISTGEVQITSNSADVIFCILSAHEIRDSKERNGFFKQLKDGLALDGKIIVAEHLRNLPNFLAYNIGFLHFHSRGVWKHLFNAAELIIEKELQITPFITVFILTKNGNPS
jgi:hypothetical protein